MRMQVGAVLGFLFQIISQTEPLKFCAQRAAVLHTQILSAGDVSSVTHIKQGFYRIPRQRDRSPLKFLEEVKSFLERKVVTPSDLLLLRNYLNASDWSEIHSVGAIRQEILERIPFWLQRNFDFFVQEAFEGRLSPDLAVTELTRSLNEPETTVAAAEATAYFLESPHFTLRSAVVDALPRIEWDLYRRLKAEDGQLPSIEAAFTILRAVESLALTELHRDAVEQALVVASQPEVSTAIRKKITAIMSDELSSMLNSVEAEAFLLLRQSQSPYALPSDLMFRGQPTRERLFGWIRIQNPLLYMSLVGSDPQKSSMALKTASLLFMVADRSRDASLNVSRFSELRHAMEGDLQPIEWEILRRQSL